MSITHTSRKGVTFYLCHGVTKTGKPRYFFARARKGGPVEAIPEGYEVSSASTALCRWRRPAPC